MENITGTFNIGRKAWLFMVYVLFREGKALMFTSRHGKVRHFLTENKIAKMVKKIPFTTQLLYDTDSYTRSVEPGVGAGRKVVRLSASTEKEEI